MMGSLYTKSLDKYTRMSDLTIIDKGYTIMGIIDRTVVSLYAAAKFLQFTTEDIYFLL